MKLLYHPLAASEVVEAARFYEDRASGLGHEFLAQVDETASRLRFGPLRWPIVETDIRRIMLKRFPFGIYYRVAGDVVRVLTVKHHRRHPGYGLERT